MKLNREPGVSHHHFRFFLCLTIIWLLPGWVCAQPAVRLAEQAGGEKIQFMEISWEEALKKAEAAHKPIFVDAYASWCGPCKQLKATTFQNPQAARFFNEHFINLSIDMEKGAGINLAAKWAIEAYPTLLIFGATGEPVLQTVGFLRPGDLIRFGKQALAKKAG